MKGPSPAVRLLEVEPDIGRGLDGEDLAAARQLTVPVLVVRGDRDSDILTRLRRAGAFGGLVLEGIVLRQLVVGDQLGMRLIGPGDLVLSGGGPPPMLVGESYFRAIPGTRVAVLGGEFMLAARRWPSLFTGVQLRWGQQADRLTTQLVICQLPRVDQRVLALMWLLAESWGRVTPTGTTLPLSLTHDALGALVGARRPTVTLALRELTERGAIIRQDQGWLLLEALPHSSGRPERVRDPALIQAEPGTWAGAPDPRAPTEARAGAAAPGQYATVQETVGGLREQHARNAARFRETLERVGRTRKRCRESRELLAGQRLSRQQPRSS